ncbi:MAG TPA: SRPBCC domain-containing protein [Chloroflexota bacterium]|nr:SRPBCC domain-containing protein [Chloroflexota bacterium]
MTVTAVRKDPRRLSLTVEAEFDASVERVWQLWADPRKLERWWGPPTYPATFTKHDLAPGSRVEYRMTGPAGDQAHRYWDVLEVEPPRRILFRDGFANADGTPNTDMPLTTIRVGIEEVAQGRTRMSIESVFPSTEAMEWVLATGFEEGLSQAVSQIDAVLAEEPSSASSRGEPLCPRQPANRRQTQRERNLDHEADDHHAGLR